MRFIIMEKALSMEKHYTLLTLSILGKLGIYNMVDTIPPSQNYLTTLKASLLPLIAASCKQ